MENLETVHVRSTKNGKLLVLFSLKKGAGAPTGFVTIVGARAPTVQARPITAAVIVIGEETILGHNVTVSQSRIVVWEYETYNGRLTHDENERLMIGGVATLKNLQTVAGGHTGYLDYQNAETGDYMDWERNVLYLE